jgi:hypothetical protein
MVYLDYLLLGVGLILLLLFIIFFIKAIKGVKEEEQLRHSSEPESGLELVAKESLKQVGERGKTLAFSFYISVFSLALARLWEWFMKPKPLAVTGVVMAGAVGWFGFLAVNTTNDDIVVSVNGPQGQFPARLLDGVQVIIEAIDSTTNDKRLIENIKFSTIEENMQPQPSKVSVLTNKDGIAFAKFSGGFKPENTVFRVRVITNESNYQSELRNDSAIFVYKKDKNEFNIYLKPKRKLVYGTLEVAGKMDTKDPALKLQPGEVTPKTFKVDVLMVNYEGQPSSDGKFFLVKPNGDSTQLDYKSGAFTAEGIEMGDKPYKINYLVEDSSKIKINLAPEGAEGKFKFEKTDKQVTLSEATKGSIAPIKPKVARAVADDEKIEKFQYTIDLGEANAKKIKNSEVTIVIGENPPIKARIVNNTIVFPETPIENYEAFWKEVPSINITCQFDFGTQNKSDFKRATGSIQKPPKDKHILVPTFKDKEIKFNAK